MLESKAQQFTMTIISGDKVIYEVDPEGVNTINVIPRTRKGDQQPRFIRVAINEDVYIYPSDFVTYVSKILDKELFNITRLKLYGYEDEKTLSIPLIIMLNEQITREDKDFFNKTLAHVLTVGHFLSSINAVSVHVRKDQTELFHQLFIPNKSSFHFPNSIKFIHLDKQMSISI